MSLHAALVSLQVGKNILELHQTLKLNILAWKFLSREFVIPEKCRYFSAIVSERFFLDSHFFFCSFRKNALIVLYSVKNPYFLE